MCLVINDLDENTDDYVGVVDDILFLMQTTIVMMMVVKNCCGLRLSKNKYLIWD